MWPFKCQGKKTEIIIKEEPLISLEQYLTASGKYPEREKHPELTPELLKNAEELLSKVNELLKKLGVKDVKVSSGFRPSDVNASIPNASKKSLHTQCRAIDIADPTGALDELLDEADALLKQLDLWVEHPDHTKGWAHIDNKNRGSRPKNVFKP